MGDCSSNEKNCCSCHAKHDESCHDGHGGHGGDKHDEFTHFLMETADEAWMEVLKDKIKEHILATQNDRMTELAKIVSETNNHRWKNKMEKKQGCADFKEKLCRFFGQSKK